MTKENLREILNLHRKWLNNKAEGEKADLHGADLDGVDLHGADLRMATMRQINLSGADLSGTNLSGANLNEAHLIEADLQGAYLYGTHLRGADLSGADLREAILTMAELDRADLRRANLFWAKGVKQFVFAKALGSVDGDDVSWDMKNDVLRCGAFCGTLRDFDALIGMTYKDKSVCLAEYKAMIRYFLDIKAVRTSNDEKNKKCA